MENLDRGFVSFELTADALSEDGRVAALHPPTKGASASVVSWQKASTLVIHLPVQSVRHRGRAELGSKESRKASQYALH
jgi:hypothetical protein